MFTLTYNFYFYLMFTLTYNFYVMVNLIGPEFIYNTIEHLSFQVN